MKKLKVLFIGHTAPLGGAELAMLRLIRYLDRRLCEPIVVLFEEGEFQKTLEKERILVHIEPLSPSVNHASRHVFGVMVARHVKLLFLALGHVIRLADRISSLCVDIVQTVH